MPNRLPVSAQRPAWIGYAVALILPVLAALVTFAIAPLRERTPLILFYPAVVNTAVVGGIGPAWLAIAISSAAGLLIFLPESELLADNLVNAATFAAVNGVFVSLAGRAHRTAQLERAQREWSQVTLRSIGDAVIVTDANAQVLMLNPAAEELTGWSEGESAGLPIHKVFQIVNESTRAIVENPIDRVRREGKVVGLANHTILIHRNGSERPIDDSGAPIFSEDERVVGAVLVFRDISERRLHEKQRAALLESERAARAEAQSASRAKDEFLAVLSHELRTPLNAIVGWTHLLRTTGDARIRERALEVIERNARRQARLIEDVLDVSRIVSGQLSFERLPVDLRNLLELVIETIRPQAHDKQIRIDGEAECGGIVIGDPQRLQQVFENLLSNAVKFTPNGGLIEISATREGSMCAVRVRDTGEGMSADFVSHAFDRFQQENSGTARRFGGLGLGLAIVRHLVEMHGGSVTAESDGPGSGSTFTVRLPLAREQAAALGAGPADVEARRLDGIRVLVVDDEPDSRELLCESLRRAGAEVRDAESTTQALERLRDFDAEILVADLAMPQQDGFELLRKVREAGFTLPAVAATAHSSVEIRELTLAAGFAAHIAKPIDANHLAREIARGVRDARARLHSSAGSEG
jgi:PAS domain S-box-containing protein